MKNLHEDSTQNKIRQILSQIKLNREKPVKRLCFHNSIIGITFQIKQYKTRTGKNKQTHQHLLQNQLKSSIAASIDCKRKKKGAGLQISKAVLHTFDGKGFTDRSMYTKNKENTFDGSTVKQNYRRVSRKLRNITATNQQDKEKDVKIKSLKREYARSISSKTQYQFQPKVCPFKPFSMHMRFRTDHQLLKPDIQGWKTQYDQSDLNAEF